MLTKGTRVITRYSLVYVTLRKYKKKKNGFAVKKIILKQTTPKFKKKVLKLGSEKKTF
jgi:hypothetical protein